MQHTFDCIICGSCVVDILVRPIALDKPIGGGQLIEVEPIELCPGGIVSNSGTAMARLGMSVAAFSYLGQDDWATLIRQRYELEGINASAMLTHPTAATSTSAVLIDPTGERTFAHCVGAPKLMSKREYLDNLHVFAKSKMMLLGYFSLLPNLEADLPEVLAAIRDTGCKTAIDAAGDGGTLQSLSPILPHLDVYVPSHAEARHQTGHDDPQKILETFRNHGAPGVIGVKLGEKGALLSDTPDQYIHVNAATPPGPVIDTTGAGDSFYAGLITGLIKGFSLENAGKLAAATGACCVTGIGASTALRGYNETAQIAGL